MGKKTIASLVTIVLLAVGAYFTSGKDIGTALKVISDKEFAASFCGALINEDEVTE